MFLLLTSRFELVLLSHSLSSFFSCLAQDVLNLEKKLLSVMERILVRQKKRLWLEHQLAAVESAAANAQMLAAATAAAAAAASGGGGASGGRLGRSATNGAFNQGAKGWMKQLSDTIFGSSSSASGGTSSSSHSLARYASGGGSSTSPSSSSSSSLALLHAPSLRSDLAALSLEVRQLEDVRRALFLEVHDLRLGREALRSSATCQGRLFNLLGYFFSAYCVYKMTMASVNIVFQRVNQMDPVSRTIQIFLVYFFDLSAVSFNICSNSNNKQRQHTSLLSFAHTV